ncbi:MAG: Glycosyltransferase AglI [Candidatus Bathyarchaeota archaeon BA2]|nr:MAG: Glycosyltransferase AglI [Candidatus Bathyarchaeota archaeon BA2]
MEGYEHQPLVSIIVPVRNGESTIEPLLESLQRLDYDKNKLEVIVVDGNSTDRTRDVVKKYPVKLIIEEKDGLNAARNAGINNSNGEIIAFTDCDCIASRDWIRKIVENFKDQRVSCVGGSAKGCDGDFVSQYADNSIIPLMPFFKKREELNMIKLFLHHPAGCNMAFRRKAFKEVGCFDESIQYGFDDVEFVERVCKAGYKMVLDPNALVWHKHRSILKEFLKQNFNYGRGCGVLFKRRGAKNVVSTWSFLSLVSFVSWLLIIGSMTFLSITTDLIIFSLLLFGFTVMPFLALMAFYLHKALENKRYERVFIYPFIDVLRGFSFFFGQIYQLFKTNKET